MNASILSTDRLPEGEGIARARARLLAIRERAAAEQLRTATTFSIMSAVGPVPAQPQTGRLALRHLPKRPRAETHEAQCEAFAEGIDLAHQAGLVKPPRVLLPTGTPNGRIANLVPMVHPVTTEQGKGEHGSSIVPCQEECYRLEVLLARLGLDLPLYVEGSGRGKPFENKVIDCGNGDVPFTHESVALFLAEHPHALANILARHRLDNGQTLSFAHLLNHPTLPLETERQRAEGERFKREDAALYYKMWRNELNVADLAAWVATVERFEAMTLMMNEDCADTLTAPGTAPFQRAAIGAAHRDETARLLRERGTEVWITEPAHVPENLRTSMLQNPQYLWAKRHLASKD